MKGKEPLALLILLAVLLCSPQARLSAGTQRHEQNEFSMEWEVVPIERPLTLPDAAARAIEKDSAVSSCLERENPPSERFPVSWFVASEIHLAGPDEADLIVAPLN